MNCQTCCYQISGACDINQTPATCDRYIAIPQPKPQRELSAWERRWIKYAKKKEAKV